MFVIGNKKFGINIVVARHCSTILNEQNRYQGVGFDYPLTERGQVEAQQLKHKFDTHGFYFDAIITSDTTRAKQTAEIATGKPVESFVVDSRLNPFDLGSAEAKREDEMFTLCRFPIFARGKENFAKYLSRVRKFLRDLFVNYNGKTVLLVTHEDISGLIDSYLSNYFILKAPRNGVKNGDARFYSIAVDNLHDEKLKPNKITPRGLHFRGPKMGFFHREELIGHDENENGKQS